MRIHNTLTKRLEEVVPPDVAAGERPLGMYVCGPTVQDVPHFGHARAALVPDVLRRVLEHRGIQVLHVRNITDVEDKIIARAAEEGRHPAAVSEEYARVYEAQMSRLGILPPHIVPRATGHIIEMIEMIAALVEREHAYVVEGDDEAIDGSRDVYFRVRSFAAYGALSGRDLDDMLAGARVEADDRKEEPGDFALWKAAKPGEPSWSSPWGPGRPGWHIECSAMSLKYLSDGFDVHAGGSDLIFPHHENEIAQAEAATGKPFARLWLHNGLLHIDGEKMAKSLGNFVTLQHALDTYGGPVLRLYYLQHHYRSTAQFGADLLSDVAAAWRRLTTFVSNAEAEGTPDARALADADAALDDDLNTPAVVAIIFEAVRAGNAALSAGDARGAADARATATEIAGIVGLDPVVHDGGGDVTPLVDLLLDLREQAREEKDYGTSDRIRDALAAGGIVVEDGHDGPRWRRA